LFLTEHIQFAAVLLFLHLVFSGVKLLQVVTQKISHVLRTEMFFIAIILFYVDYIFVRGIS